MKSINFLHNKIHGDTSLILDKINQLFSLKSKRQGVVILLQYSYYPVLWHEIKLAPQVIAYIYSENILSPYVL